ncbi:MAG: hypothetical protein HKO98_07555 [Gemmatimonadetes bacterium]|nr:hypothetical protein [Gemmatimonadota bacterium]
MLQRIRTAAAVVAATAALTACESGVSAPDGGSGLILTVTAAQAGATSGRLYIEGPTNRTITLSPGDQREIDLPAGGYTVALEGLDGSTVVGFWERSVTVRDGQQTPVTVSLAPFAVNAPSAATTAEAGVPITVTWSGVTGAATYDVEVSASPDFTALLDQQNVSGTSAQFTVSQSGTVYFRVRPRTRFEGIGAYSAPSSGTLVRVPVARVEVSPPFTQIDVGQSTTFTATTFGPSDEVLSNRDVVWSSSNPSVATVDANGQVSALAAGDTDIEATSEGVTGSALLTVVDPNTGTPPAVNTYDVVFVPVIAGCGEGFRDFRTDESVVYVDNDADMDPGRMFSEPFGGTPVGIQSQWREEGATDWKPFGYDKGWTPDVGATGTTGRLAANGSTCWDFDDADPPTFVHFRARVQDAAGNFSDWFERRLDMPETVVVTPTGDLSVFAMNPGDTQAFTAEARDANGLVVPGDPINWSSYVGAPHATVDAMGNLTIDANTIGGLDWMVARAGYADGATAVQAGFSDGSWYSPGWFSSGLALTQGSNLMFQVRVYEGREYTIRTGPDGSGNSTGDVDIFIRFGQAATNTDFDEFSNNGGLDDSITWTASADGILYVFLYAFTDFSAARFAVEGLSVPPRATQVFPSPAAGPAGHMRLVTDEASAGAVPLLLPPLSVDRPVAANARLGGR